MAKAGRARLHDAFHCPRAEEPWHEEALALVLEAETTRSKRLEGLILEDLRDLLRNHP